jgi:DNA repair exonuclease SbcCD ATPase subunit
MANRNMVAMTDRHTDLEERVKQLEECVKQLEESVRALETQCNQTLPALIETKANEARDDAVAEATRLANEVRTDAIAEAGKLANEARDAAIAEATGLVAALSQKHDDLATIVDKSAKDIEDLKNPQGAVERIAQERLALYRNSSQEELQKEVVEDAKKQPEVLKEIARRLDPDDNTDSTLLTRIFTFVENDELMAELVTVSGTGNNTSALALGGSLNGR